MKKKLFLPLLAALLLTPWPVAYAHDHAAGQAQVQIEAAGPEATPHWKAFGNAIGGVNPGDLFYVDTGGMTTDIPVTLYITNTDELVHYYRYLTLKVGLYVQTGEGQWEKAAAGNAELLPDTYITMLSGRASFTLPGYAKYKITIDKGCFYRYGTVGEGEAISPTFYLASG